MALLCVGLLHFYTAGCIRPNLVLAGCDDDDDRRARAYPVLADRTTRDGRAAVSFCEHYVCQAPVTEVSELAELLKK